MNEFFLWCGDRSYLAIEHDICPNCPSERENDLSCPCGNTDYLSNSFSFLEDKNFYCKSCVESKWVAMREELDKAKTLQEGLLILEDERKAVSEAKK